MAYSTRLATSIHILLAIYRFDPKEKVTSTVLADSIQTNPVMVRTLLGKLQKAGLIRVEAGIGGAHLTKDPKELTLLDIFLAVEDPEKFIFKSHDDPNPKCEVGRVVHSVLNPRLDDLHQQFLKSLKSINLASLIQDMEKRIS